jgi:hypothetical protein
MATLLVHVKYFTDTRWIADFDILSMLIQGGPKCKLYT